MRPLSILIDVLVLAASLTAQRPAERHRSLEGTWTNATLTPLQRPAEFAGKPHFTPEEAEHFRRTTVDRLNQPNPEPGRALQQTFDNVVAEATDMKVLDDLRTSLIVDPPDGRLPALLPTAQARRAARPQQSFDNFETIGPPGRCLAFLGPPGSPTAPPIIPTLLGNNYYQFVETPGAVLIFSESIHDARVVRIGGTHLPVTIRQWLGDSVGRWEGKTLVVDTTNFRSDTHFLGSGERLHVVERFERVDDRTIHYRATVEDPDTWATPWTVEIPVQGHRSADLRVRVPRRQPRDGELHARRSRRRTANGRRKPSLTPARSLTLDPRLSLHFQDRLHV